MKIIWTEPAIADLEAIKTYIARDSEIYANAVILEIFEATERLETFPRSGRIVPEFNESDTREVIVGNYRVIYDISGESVRILTVLHGARQFPPSQ